MPRLRLSTALLAAFALAGCGGSPGTVTSHTTGPAPAGNAPSRASTERTGYIAGADALCKSAAVRQEALRRRAKGLPASKLVPILRQQASIAGTLAADLGKLNPPTGDHVSVGRFVRAVHQLAVYSQAVANSIAARHVFAARALAAKLSLARQQETLLGQGYGYKICSSGKSY